MDAQNDLQRERNDLKKLILDRSFQQGSHYRTPTKIVDNYFDFFEISLKHQGVHLTSNLVHNELKDLDIVAVGGPGDSIKSILCRVAYMNKIGVFYVRDSIRKEGDLNAPKWLESRIKAGDKVALIGDVISSGSRMISAIEQVMQFGAVLQRIVVIIDSEDGSGREKITRFLDTNQLDASLRVLFTQAELKQ